jgi:hypothetical protein
LEHMLQEDEISFSVLWELGLEAIWVLIKWSKDSGLAWKTWWRAVSMGLICCPGRRRLLLRNQYPLCWLASLVFNILSLFVCNYSELVEWPRGAFVGLSVSCGVCQIMANSYEGVILLMSLTVKDGSCVRETGHL